MRLSYICSACKAQNFIDKAAETRPELKMKLNADEIVVNCKKCGKTDKKHINRIDAIIDYRIILIGLFFGAVATILVLQLGYIALLTFLIPIFFWRQEMEKTNRFNKTLIKRKNA